MKVWNVSNSQLGFTVGLEETPWWAQAVSDCTLWLCGRTGHVLCGSGMPQSLWRIPVGRPKWETDPFGTKFLANSLAARIMRITEVFHTFSDMAGKRELTILVPPSTGAALWGPENRFWETDPEPEPDRF